MVSYAAIRATGAFDPACSTRIVLDHVMSRWGVLVLCTLSEGTHRWGALRREVEGISEKMLASTLRQLVADGIVHRESLPTVPPHVEYCLTERGEDLMQHMLPLIGWIADRADEIMGTPEERLGASAQPLSARA